MVDRVFALEDIVAAHRHLESNAQVGKIVVTTGGAP
ncbi:zinc-binding dehydrogenase [Catenulispora yoronensis]